MGFSEEQKQALRQSIIELFELFRVAYPSQYTKTYFSQEKEQTAKRIWFRYLKPFAPEIISKAADYCVQNEKFLPSLNTFLNQCRPSYDSMGLPEAHAAYREACMKPSPKSEQAWSHPVVYFAGKASEWHFLASTSEKIAFPVFERHYDVLCKRIIAGESLDIEVPKAIPQSITPPLSKEQQRNYLKELRKKTGI